MAKNRPIHHPIRSINNMIGTALDKHVFFLSRHEGYLAHWIKIKSTNLQDQMITVNDEVK